MAETTERTQLNSTWAAHASTMKDLGIWKPISVVIALLVSPPLAFLTEGFALDNHLRTPGLWLASLLFPATNAAGIISAFREALLRALFLDALVWFVLMLSLVAVYRRWRGAW